MGVKLDASERILKVWKKTHSCHLDIDNYVVLKSSRAMWSVVCGSTSTSTDTSTLLFISVTTQSVYRFCDSEDTLISSRDRVLL